MIRCALTIAAILHVVCSSLPAVTEPTAMIYVGGNNPIVSCFEINNTTGLMTLKSSSNAGINPCYLAWDTSRRFVYALNEVAPGKITALSVNPSTGALTKINESIITVGTGARNSQRLGPACHIACHPTGQWVITTHYGTGHVVVHAVRPDGGIGAPVASVIAGVHAHQAVMNAAGTQLFVPCLGSNYIAQYAVRFTAGNLSAHIPASFIMTPEYPATASSGPDRGPRHVVFAPNGNTAYGINEIDNSITSYAFNALTGTLTRIAAVKTIPADYYGVSYAAHIQVSPDGKFVYGSNRGHDSIAIFATNTRNRILSLVGYETAEGTLRRPRDFSVTPDGAWLIVANENSNSLTVFRVNKVTGRLTKTSTVTVPERPTFVGTMMQQAVRLTVPRTCN